MTPRTSPEIHDNRDNGALSSVDISGNEISAVDMALLAPYSSILDPASRALLEAEGQDSNALAGGTFVSRPVASKTDKAGMIFGILSGYFDVYADIAGDYVCLWHLPLLTSLLAVTIQWHKEGEYWLVALSTCAMVLPVIVQLIAVDKSAKRRLLTFFQLKVGDFCCILDT